MQHFRAEINPVTEQVVWSCPAKGGPDFLDSAKLGSVQRLANGNTLITESDYGRAFEITPDGATVWEFYNPHRAGDEGQFIATLMEVSRLPEDFGADWAERSVKR